MSHANAREQSDVNRYFQSSSRYWNDIYFDRELLPTVYRERQNTALDWIRELGLPASARILEIGCGAGFLSLALAAMGFLVDAMDSTEAMVELTRRHADEAGAAGRIHVSAGDAHALSAYDATYDLVVALGVIPWLHSEAKAVVEMKRVLKAPGYLLLTADNEARLNRLLDPFSTPLLKPLRSAAKRLVGNSSPTEGFQAKRHYPGQIDRMLKSVGLRKVRGTTIGFGTLTFAGKQLLPDALAIRLHRRLQGAAHSRVFPFSNTGLHYMTLAEKLPPVEGALGAP